MKKTNSSFYSRIETEIDNYLTQTVELAPGVYFNQYKLINRIYKFKNRDISGSKLNSDLSYNYHFDITSPRCDNEIKNLRIDSKNILVYSSNPKGDFAPVFLANATLRRWMAEAGEDVKLKSAVEEYVANGNVGFKKTASGYDLMDPLNTIVTNISAETVDDTDFVERHEMTASQIMGMEEWDRDKCKEVVEKLGNKSFKKTELTKANETTSKRYEIYEFTGQVSRAEFNEVNGKESKDGDENEFFLAKIITAGLRDNHTGEKYTLFSHDLSGKKMSDYYQYAHRGRYEGRFWRVGIVEMLFDHQIRANEIGNQLARGLDWASKVVFRSKDSRILQNIRADVDNGDIIITDDLDQVPMRMYNLDQFIADWNRLTQDADRLTNSLEIVRGDTPPSGTPFRMGVLLDENAGKLYILLRQKITLPYKQVFKNWVMPNLIKDLTAKEIFQFVGDAGVLDRLREVAVDSWYAQNLVHIGPHTQEQAEAIKQEKLDEMRRVDPAVKNHKDIWKGVLPRLQITITGENSGLQDQVQDLMALIQFETDPERRNWILDTLYAIRGIPIPPRKEQQPPDPVMSEEGEVIQENSQLPQPPTQLAGQANNQEASVPTE